MAVSDKVASVYAEALLGLSVEAGEQEAVEAELRDLSAMFLGDEAVWGFFRSPLIQGDVKMKVLDSQVKGKISKLLYNFLGVLAGRRRFLHLPDIAEAYSDLLDQHLGRRRVEVLSAVSVGEAEQAALKSAIEKYTGQTVIMSVTEDAALLGGMKIRSGDLLIDSSYQSKLASLRQILTTRKILGEEYYEN